MENGTTKLLDFHIEVMNCEVCGKPTVMKVLGHPCHDCCLEGLIKKYPEKFTVTEVSR